MKKKIATGLIKFFFSLSLVFALVPTTAAKSTFIKIEKYIPNHYTNAKLQNSNWDKPKFDKKNLLLDSTSNDHNYKIWITAAPEGILFKVTVFDKEHSRKYDERTLWMGDALYISLDSRGNTPDGTVSKTLQDDDFTAIFGLGKKGAEAIMNNDKNTLIDNDEAQLLIRTITRNEKSKVTTYELAIPWEKINSNPSVARSIGVAVLIKDEGKNGSDFTWGISKKEIIKLKRYQLPEFNTTFTTIIPVQTQLKKSDENAQLLVGWKNTSVDQIAVSIANEKCTQDVKSLNGSYQIEVRSDLIKPNQDSVKIELISNNKIVKTFNVGLETKDILYAHFNKRINQLLKTSTHELISTHLKSTKLVVDQAYQTMHLPQIQNRHKTDDVELFFSTIKILLEKMPTEKYEFDLFTKQCIPLTFVFRSSLDYSLQFYTLQLPYNWQPEKKYPLTVYLHGSGPGHPLEGLETGFDNSGQNTLFRNVDINPDTIPGAHLGFLVAPWGRGNNGYEGYAENDIFEIVELLQNQFQVIKNKMYISGFSMGCNGALRIAVKKPELWAGANFAAGFHHISYWKNNPELKKLKSIPMNIWVGELDERMYSGMKEFMIEADKIGLKYVSKVVPNTPHTYPYWEYMNSIQYLMQFEKK